MRNPLQSVLEGQVGQMQRNITRALEELEVAEIEGSAGGSAVKVRMTGAGQVLSVEISPAAVEPEDLELLQDLVCAAMRDAIAKATALKREKLMSATPFGALGMEMPDVF